MGAGFTTTQGGAPASALNPAQGGDAQRWIFDLGYIGLGGLGDEPGYGNIFDNLVTVIKTATALTGNWVQIVKETHLACMNVLSFRIHH
jgi:hypothetical protein